MIMTKSVEITNGKNVHSRSAVFSYGSLACALFILGVLGSPQGLAGQGASRAKNAGILTNAKTKAKPTVHEAAREKAIAEGYLSTFETSYHLFNAVKNDDPKVLEQYLETWDLEKNLLPVSGTTRSTMEIKYTYSLDGKHGAPLPALAVYFDATKCVEKLLELGANFSGSYLYRYELDQQSGNYSYESLLATKPSLQMLIAEEIAKKEGRIGIRTTAIKIAAAFKNDRSDELEQAIRESRSFIVDKTRIPFQTNGDLQTSTVIDGTTGAPVMALAIFFKAKNCVAKLINMGAQYTGSYDYNYNNQTSQHSYEQLTQATSLEIQALLHSKVAEALLKENSVKKTELPK